LRQPRFHNVLYQINIVSCLSIQNVVLANFTVFRRQNYFQVFCCNGTFVSIISARNFLVDPTTVSIFLNRGCFVLWRLVFVFLARAFGFYHIIGVTALFRVKPPASVATRQF
jgi:hypothetical protein